MDVDKSGRSHCSGKGTPIHTFCMGYFYCQALTEEGNYRCLHMVLHLSSLCTSPDMEMVTDSLRLQRQGSTSDTVLGSCLSQQLPSPKALGLGFAAAKYFAFIKALKTCQTYRLD